MPRNHHAQNLARAFADGHEARIAIHAFDLKFATVALAAVNLDGIATDPFAHFGCHQLGHAGFFGIGFALVAQPCRPVYHKSRRLYLSRGVGEHKLDRLVLADGFAEGFPLFGVL